ncbi:MAG: fumarate hydratase, class [Acidimicrobiaceae bacterium]|jgi:fumarate hydratase class II|nr:fumarate hydratase, class [Acidimicrobiaceae bacterium]MDQ1400383.1 fumarate hydratase, class [Acidimicrobiaceae bacterium]MDQ1420252.1 fumarate hydratase, class [Acidimicrobiaceae bacterium]MDQ1440702.1 fumarate hydratase, class [Acidimicrobiaceae bacterium]
MGDFRVEHDTLGEVRVPAGAKWAAQTQRAIENFPVSGMHVDRALIRALALLKGAAAVENARLGVIEPTAADAIAEAAAEVAAGDWDTEFPVDVYQTGSGTSSNMNMNEVLATLAGEKLGRTVHPNDEVNASQSSNDVFPSAIHLAAVDGIVNHLIPALEHLAQTLRTKSEEWRSVVKAGRTHLMDATPVTLGQEFGGYATAVEHGIERLGSALPRVGELPLGGTAVGTGLNAPEGFAGGSIGRLASELELPLTEARDHFEAQGGRDALVEASGALRTVAVSLYKCANDVRWMGSGPRCGLAEIHLPDLQPGSSIMPGKVNPVIAEAVCQVVAQVVGNDAAVAFGGAAGNFELNIMLPVMGRNLLESIRLLASVSWLFADRCISGIEADVERTRTYALSSPAMATALNPYIGYEEAARVVKAAAAEGKDLRTVVLERGLMTPEEIDRILDPEAMTRGGILR